MDDLLKLKGHATLLMERRKRLERSILHADFHTDGSLVEKYRKCGKPGCKCAQGELHGPALYLSRRVDGKTRYDYVPEDKADLARVLVERHVRLYKARAQIQKINQELNEVLDQIVKCRHVEFPSKAEQKGGMRTMPHRQVFRFDPEGVVEAMRLGEPAECIESKFGYNDHVINWFSEKGFWRIWESMRADVKRANGIPQECLNGVFAALTLSRIGSIQKADPMLEDGRLMTELGFNIITVQKRLKDGKGVIHRDTLRNHVKRIPVAESKRAFYEHVSLMRSRKWLRGGVYAADGMKIEVTSGKSYEGCGRVWDPERKQFVFGYKVVYVFNLSPERPRIIAIAIGPINADERTLLVEALQDLRAHVCNPRDIIDILVLDRGYWGVEHLSRLKGEFGLDIVTICKAGLTIHDEAQRLVALDQGKRPLIRHRRRVNNQGHESRYIRRIRAVEGLEALDKAGTVSIRLNAVCVSEVDEDSGEASDTIFLTTLDVSANSAKVVDYYDQRWSIENRCNRELSQNWNVRRPIGRRLTAIFAQLCMASMCLNAVRIYREHKPKDAEKLESEMRTQGHKSYMLGRGAVVIVPGRQIYATMRYVRYLNLLALKAARRSAELASQGIPMEQVLEIVSQEMKE